MSNCIACKGTHDICCHQALFIFISPDITFHITQPGFDNTAGFCQYSRTKSIGFQIGRTCIISPENLSSIMGIQSQSFFHIYICLNAGIFKLNNPLAF